MAVLVCPSPHTTAHWHESDVTLSPASIEDNDAKVLWHNPWTVVDGVIALAFLHGTSESHTQ